MHGGGIAQDRQSVGGNGNGVGGGKKYVGHGSGDAEVKKLF